MPAQKYKLFKRDPSTGEAPPCAFFFSEKGCKNGDQCRFSHKRPATTSDEPKCEKAPPPTQIEDIVSSDVVSSESEDEHPASTPKVQQPKKAKNKGTNNNTSSSPPPSSSSASAMKQQPNTNNTNNKTPTKTPNNTPKSNKKRKKKDQQETNFDSSLGIFANPKKRTKTVDQSPAKKLAETPKQQQQKAPNEAAAKTPVPTVPSFRALNLPIATFSTEDGTVQAVDPTPPPTVESQYPIPKSTPEGRKWQNAVLATRANPKYASVFDYDKCKTADIDAKITHTDWIKARPYGSWCASHPHAIAIDCEMCETTCPETGAVDHKALCRLSVVNACNPSEVLIDTLVKPSWPVTDYRTRINGIKKENLDIVEFTLKHAQEFLMALCSDETVIIGHALHNDFFAMKMEHHCNVDSALLFSCKDAPDATCSLKDLARTVMKKEMPNIHCSTNDARTTLLCIEDGYLKTGGKPELVERTVKPNRRPDTDLFVHRIPKGCKPDHIKNMFLAYTSIIPEEVPDLEYKGDTGKVNVTFASRAHANLAFSTLEGEAKEDKGGRMQKRIYLRNGDYCYIRKMTLGKKRPSVSNDVVEGKGKEGPTSSKEAETPTV
mmetsp:Transcript_8234/g.12399  ORF Transcript_8234/g.12399 Transcript_8234/m.12399 type:complete len:604 (-) Transcript_8234:43-1854(-)|eukprot:CAMPEP_0203683134 /NCGR_PEP_ID=MMETSP0090-20130426/47361_1 /ASSEMBLY_ACC=CAM_ASM_001088 /TAXON_ID=426623 /ORGANISM="Chaetoceros affinis, Strain CCMP159" /LENGTH=603 /DNA_ID=CAMNT_0050552259 /DNA_START=30 /DNA_END=1841 /DNA_ORIENTATION=-